MKMHTNKIFSSNFIFIVFLSIMLASCATTGKSFPPFEHKASLSKELLAADRNQQDTQFSIEEISFDKHNSFNNDEHERLGDLYFSRGDYIMSFVQYEKSLKANPGNTEIYYKKGILSIAGGNCEEAIKEFQKVLLRDPEHIRAHYGIGLAYFQTKQYEKSKMHVEKVIELDESFWKAHNLLGMLYDYEKNQQLAIQSYERAIAQNPENGLLYNNLGIAYSLASEPEKALSAFNSALVTHSSYSKIYNNLGVVLSSLGKYQEAFEAFRKGGDDAQAFNNLGSVYMSQGQYGKAIESFQKAVELRPDFYSKANENLRKCIIAQGKELSLDSDKNIVPQIQLPQSSDRLKTHIVCEGDTLYKIAKRYGSTVTEIQSFNELETKKLIKGQKLLIPPI